MGLFLKTTAGILITVFIVLQIDKQSKDIGVLLRAAAGVMAGITLLTYMEPVLSLLADLRQLGDLRIDYLSILIKVMGIGLITEIAGSVCTDGGSSSLGKTLNMLGVTVVLYLSIPVFRALVDLIQQIVGEA